MGHSYEKSKKIATKTIIILGVITIFEVLIALLGKGYLIDGVEIHLVPLSLSMIILSLIKAYLIVYEFMHMKYEVPSLVKTVLIPTGLLVWAVIAFFYEGNDWKARRNLIINKNKEEVNERVIEKSPTQEGMIEDFETKKIG